MYSVIWQITKKEEAFLATPFVLGTYGKIADWMDFEPCTRYRPITAPTLEELRAVLKAPPYGVFSIYKHRRTPAPPDVIEEWS